MHELSDSVKIKRSILAQTPKIRHGGGGAIVWAYFKEIRPQDMKTLQSEAGMISCMY